MFLYCNKTFKTYRIKTCPTVVLFDKLYSPEMVVTIYKYTIENNLTKKREKKKEKHTNKWHVLI